MPDSRLTGRGVGDRIFANRILHKMMSRKNIVRFDWQRAGAAENRYQIINEAICECRRNIFKYQTGRIPAVRGLKPGATANQGGTAGNNSRP